MEQKKHKHYDVIIAYANGATIEWRDPERYGSTEWDELANPRFFNWCEYRVKPQVVKKYANIYTDKNGVYFLGPFTYDSREDAIQAARKKEGEYVDTVEFKE